MMLPQATQRPQRQEGPMQASTPRLPSEVNAGWPVIGERFHPCEVAISGGPVRKIS
jgi:hypothetical protein